MRFKKFAVSLLVVCILMHAKNALSLSEFPDPKFALDAINRKQFIVEHVYIYYEQLYRQPLSLTFIDKDKSLFSTPEDAFVTLMSAMRQLDVQWTLDCWDKTSRDKLAIILSDSSVLERVKAEWQNLYQDSNVILLRRVDRKSFVIIDYLVKGKDGSENRSTFTFSLENGNWKATNTYSDDPIANNLNSNIDKIQVPGD